MWFHIILKVVHFCTKQAWSTRVCLCSQQTLLFPKVEDGRKLVPIHWNFFFPPKRGSCHRPCFFFFFAYTLYFRTVAFTYYLHVCCRLHCFEQSVRLPVHPCVVFIAASLQKTEILTLSPAFRRQIPTAPLFLHFDIHLTVIWLMMNCSFGVC